jgi:hypothetical protein
MLEEEAVWLETTREREEVLVPDQVKYHVDDQEIVQESAARTLKALAETDLLSTGEKNTTGKQDEPK